jgi:hypothetical protein
VGIEGVLFWSLAERHKAIPAADVRRLGYPFFLEIQIIYIIQTI